MIWIRLLEPADAAAALDLLLRNRAFLEPFEPARPDDYFTLEGMRASLRGLVAERDGDRAYGFGIFAADGRLVGRITLSGVARGALRGASLGYLVDEARGSRGYATEAVRQAVGYAFDELGLHRVQAAVMPRNVRSVRVLEKAGFREEGLALRYLCINGAWEDHRLFARTSDD